MRAIKLKADVEADHSMCLELPADVPKGPAEIIILIGEPDVPVRRPPLSKLLLRLRAKDGRSRLEIDRDVERERAAWRD